MPLEEADRTRRELVSAVKRLRVLATSDPERGDELAEALVRLTGARLLAWDFAEAAADAPEAVLLAARILARSGAAGPYTAPGDATRYFTATAILAAVQAGLGQVEGAGRTLDGLTAWLQQLGRLPIREHLEAPAVVWALATRARSLLATDPAAANSFADAAAQRLYAAGLDAAPGYQSLTVHLIVADCRWAAGHAEAALAHHRLALAAHRRAVGEVTRPRPGLAQAALAPLEALHEPYALRLEALGYPGLAVAVRRQQVVRLQELGADAARLATARRQLAGVLARTGRKIEAEAESTAAAALAPQPGLAAAEPPTAPGARSGWSELTPAEALAPGELPAAGRLRLEAAVRTAVAEGSEAIPAADRAEAELRGAAEQAAAEQAEARALAELRARAEAEAAKAAAAERENRAAQLLAERRAAEAAAARSAAQERRRQLAQEHRRPAAVDAAAAAAAAAELEAARDRVRAAGPDDLGSLRDASERLADLLRPLARLEPEQHLPEFVATLESLVGLRWRSGDPDASREAAREARAIAGEAGR